MAQVQWLHDLDQALALLRSHDESGAGDIYHEVLRRFPTSAVAAEAQYYLAVARYKASGQGKDLATGWHQLQKQYPNSIWRIKQLCTEKGE